MLPNPDGYEDMPAGVAEALIFMHTLEPHNNGDEFVQGLIELVLRLGVTEYTMIGSMYAPVPHTRRPVINSRGTMSSVSPLPATPAIVHSPQPMRAASTAWAITPTLPVASKV